MSPEQARGHALDGRADLYSLGVMLFEMLTGAPPYMADEAVALGLKHCQDPIPRLPAELAKLQPLIDRLMAKQRTDRIPDARTLIKEIDALLAAGISAVPAKKAAAPVMLSTTQLGLASQAATVVKPAMATADAPASRPAEHFFDTEETVSGGFLSKKSALHVRFSCEDYEALKRQLGKLQEELKTWLDKRGKKASHLQLDIQAHPWIHGRVREVFARAREENSPLATVLGQAEVVLHLFDDQDPVGRTIKLSDKDGKPAPAPTSAG